MAQTVRKTPTSREWTFTRTNAAQAEVSIPVAVEVFTAFRGSNNATAVATIAGVKFRAPIAVRRVNLGWTTEIESATIVDGGHSSKSIIGTAELWAGSIAARMAQALLP